jgi:transcriptional regulator with PAS, ATPase and Fis domain
LLKRFEEILLRGGMMNRPIEVQPLKEIFGINQLVGKDQGFLKEIRKIHLIAKHDIHVLITGETGTGKELFAKAIHYLSNRSGGPFVPINCPAIPQDLMENELFGHEGGAYTGSGDKQLGLIAEGEGGTVFFDEMNLLTLRAQAKLLRFLQEGEMRSLGSGKLRRANVRVVAAMNADVAQVLREHSLREDLFYRLSAFQIELPPLRKRPEDIPLLARHFLSKWSVGLETSSKELSPGAMKKLVEHDSPGNVRELENIIERAALLSEGSVIEPSEIEILDQSSRSRVDSGAKKELIEVPVAHEGNISHAAHALGKNRRTIQRLIHRYEIDLHNLSKKEPF